MCARVCACLCGWVWVRVVEYLFVCARAMRCVFACPCLCSCVCLCGYLIAFAWPCVRVCGWLFVCGSLRACLCVCLIERARVCFFV